MARTTLHFLLIAAVTTCPLWCTSGRCAATESCESTPCAARRCCERASNQANPPASLPTDDAPAEEAPCDSGPCDTCQCICSGAVMESQDDEVKQQSENPLHDVVVITNSAIESLQSRTPWTICSNEDGGAAGRNLRILHSSMLL